MPHRKGKKKEERGERGHWGKRWGRYIPGGGETSWTGLCQKRGGGGGARTTTEGRDWFEQDKPMKRRKLTKGEGKVYGPSSSRC